MSNRIGTTSNYGTVEAQGEGKKRPKINILNKITGRVDSLVNKLSKVIMSSVQKTIDKKEDSFLQKYLSKESRDKRGSLSGQLKGGSSPSYNV